jgi:5-methylcytosine-specific restriction enzyme A
MPDFSIHTGNPPNEFAMRFIRALEAKGFNVAPTLQGPSEDPRKTLRITWRGIYIGQMSEGLWG